MMLAHSFLFFVVVASAIPSEIRHLEGHKKENDYRSPLPYTYLDPSDLPDSFTWQNVHGVSYVTRSLNQHLPQWCGSCWAHGALSALADRIKIARGAKGDDINLSIQWLLNCGANVAGSCHGGSGTGAYEFIKQQSYIPYETCQPYLACSSDSDNGFCPHIDTTCSAENTCRTCESFLAMFDFRCNEITHFPNATVAEYGIIRDGDVFKIQAEIFARGPVAAEINGKPIHDYHGGIYMNETADTKTSHIVSIVGWGVDEDSDVKYWIVRNSWGQYWGELGYFRIAMGKNILGIESGIIFATPGFFSETNFPCAEDGKNCKEAVHSFTKYIDPSQGMNALLSRRLAS